MAERDSLMQIWHQATVMKNDLILSERNLVHLYGPDSRDWIVVREYANWEDVEAAADKQGELWRAAMPDTEARMELPRFSGHFFAGVFGF